MILGFSPKLINKNYILFPFIRSSAAVPLKIPKIIKYKILSYSFYARVAALPGKILINDIKNISAF